MSAKINMTKARDIHIHHIRKARDGELKALDVDFLRAVEGGDVESQATIKGKKEDLRAMPQNMPTVESFGTPAEIKSYRPSGGAFGSLSINP